MLKDKTKRICLWSGPRNISTALMYSFANRSDTQVYDEPLYAYYLRQTNASSYHPGATDVLTSMENNGQKVVEMMMGEHKKSVVFFKNMTHHLIDLDRSFMKETINIILTRDPVEMIPSFAKVIDNPTINDLGYEQHIQLVNDLHEMNIEPIVIDSKKLLLNPKKILNQLCNLCGIPFEELMLHWKPGPIKEDGIWAKYWYENIHKSSGFVKYKAKTSPFPDKFKPLLKSCVPYYEQLIRLALD